MERNLEKISNCVGIRYGGVFRFEIEDCDMVPLLSKTNFGATKTQLKKQNKN